MNTVKCNLKGKEEVLLQDREIINFKYINIDNFEVLKELLRFNSISGKEEKVAEYVKKELLKCNFLIEVDKKGNIYATRGIADWYPIINAHLDIVDKSNKYSSYSKKSTKSTKSTGFDYNNKYSSLVMNDYDYDYDYESSYSQNYSDYIGGEEEEEDSYSSAKANKAIFISDDDANKLWDKDKEELRGWMHKDFRFIGLTCRHCVNNCKGYKLCFYFGPNETIEVKRKYAEFKKKEEMELEFEKQEKNKYVQESFNLNCFEKKCSKDKPKVKKNEEKSTEEKYIITVDLINDIISGKGQQRVLGGDDKAGIFIALMVAKLLPDVPMKLLFTVQEETGCHGVKHFVKHHKEWLDNVKYSLTIDRREGNHLLWSQKGVRSCDNNFASEVMYQGVRTGLAVSIQDGGSADVVTLRDYVPNAINMSAGYYKAHTTAEYIKPTDVDNIIGWVKNIIENI